jgi:threonine dehydratase
VFGQEANTAALAAWIERWLASAAGSDPAGVHQPRSGTVASTVSNQLSPTRLVRSAALSERVGDEVYLKLELELPTGSFKVRGALYALSKRLERGPITEVVAASTGNHGAAVAWAASELGVKAQIFVPVGANAVKTARIRSLGAHLTEVGADIEAARRAAEHRPETDGAFLLDDATNADVPVGAGTIGSEIVDQLPNCATVVVPVGDSALIRGVASAVKTRLPDAVIVGVQAERAPAYYESWRAGRVITTETADTMADGLATTTPTADNVVAVRELVDAMVLVTETELLDAIRWLSVNEGIVVEPAAAAAVAVLLKSGQTYRGPIVVVLTGQNLAPELARVVAASR